MDTTYMPAALELRHTWPGTQTGHEPNYLDPENNARPGLRASIALLVFAWVLVSLRLSTRFVDGQRKWKLHDYFAMLGLVITCKKT